MKIKIEKPDKKALEEIKNWPIWEKDESSFDWSYDCNESCYFLEGEAEIQLPDGKKVTIQKGDLVTFPKGLKCTWNIKKKVRKHYNFG
jgi:hypothetical protein